MITRPDLVRRGTVAVLRAAAPVGTVVSWGRQYAPRNPRRHLELHITATRVRGPALGVAVVKMTEEPTQILWTLAGVAEGERVGLALTGARWMHTVTAGDTVETARDSLLAILVEGAVPGAAITAVGADSIRLDTGATLGFLWGACALGPQTSISTEASQVAEVVTRPTTSVIELQAYAYDEKGQTLEAEAALASVLGSLEASSLVTLAIDHGIVMSKLSDVVNISALSGADWSSRAMARVNVTSRSYVAFATEEITIVDYAVGQGPAIQGSVSKP